MPWHLVDHRRTARAPALLPALLVAVVLLASTSACLPDQLDGRLERVEAEPALDLSWFEEVSASEALDAGLVAMAQLRSVRLRQDVESPVDESGVLNKDLVIATGSGIGDAVAGDCTGSLQLPSWGEPAELVVQDDLGAFRGDAAFWRSFGADSSEVSAVSEVLVEQYADTWTTAPGLATLCELPDFLAPVADALGDDEATKAGLGDVAGVPAGRVVSMSPSLTITTWVQVAEPHRILRVALDRLGTGSEDSVRTVTTFSDIDAVVDVDFPAPEDIVPFVLPTPEPVTGG